MEIARSGHLHLEAGETVWNIDDGLDFEWAVRGFCLCVEICGVFEVAKLESLRHFHTENTQVVCGCESAGVDDGDFGDSRSDRVSTI